MLRRKDAIPYTAEVAKTKLLERCFRGRHGLLRWYTKQPRKDLIGFAIVPKGSVHPAHHHVVRNASTDLIWAVGDWLHKFYPCVMNDTAQGAVLVLCPLQ